MCVCVCLYRKKHQVLSCWQNHSSSNNILQIIIIIIIAIAIPFEVNSMINWYGGRTFNGDTNDKRIGGIRCVANQQSVISVFSSSGSSSPIRINLNASISSSNTAVKVILVLQICCFVHTSYTHTHIRRLSLLFFFSFSFTSFIASFARCVQAFYVCIFWFVQLIPGASGAFAVSFIHSFNRSVGQCSLPLFHGPLLTGHSDKREIDNSEWVSERVRVRVRAIYRIPTAYTTVCYSMLFVLFQLVSLVHTFVFY